MKRYGVLIGLKPEAEAKYREHHGTDFAADMPTQAERIQFRRSDGES